MSQLLLRYSNSVGAWGGRGSGRARASDLLRWHFSWSWRRPTKRAVCPKQRRRRDNLPYTDTATLVSIEAAFAK